MKRALWTAKISSSVVPPWPCPRCKAGTLALLSDSLVVRETPDSVAAHDDENWEPEWNAYVFSAWLQCGNHACAQPVSVVGKGGVEPELDEEHGTVWADAHTPLYAYPMPDMFEIPQKCPDAIAVSLRQSFSAFWSSPTAAANNTRTALEHLLDSMGVPKKRKNKKGAFSTLALHARIEQLQKVNPAIGNQLMAVKWLGNTGSHRSNVDREELLDAYELVEHALEELIDERSKRIVGLVKSLTKKHGPRKK